MRKLRRLALFLLRVALVCLAFSVLAFLMTSHTHTPAERVVERDPFPWEADREADITEFRGPKKRNLKTALVRDDIFTVGAETHNVSATLSTPLLKRTTPHAHHQRSKYNYTVVQYERQRALDATCREQAITRERWRDLPAALQDTVAQRIIVNEEHSLLFCPVPLTASGSWMKVLYLLGPGKHLHNMADIPSRELTKRENFVYLSSFSLEEREEKLETYLKFMVTRHPFLRLAIAYKMKFEADNVFFHERYGKEIVRLYRSGATQQETGSDVRFGEFVEYLLHLQDSEEMNEHWQPLQTLCRPCQVGYDYILHYETLDPDSTELLREAGLLRRVPSLPHDSWDDVPTQYVNSLFQQITPAWVGQLVRKYQDDFAMFSYGSLF